MKTRTRWLRCTLCGHEFIAAADDKFSVSGIFTGKVDATCPSCGKTSGCVVIRSVRGGRK